MGVSTAPDEFQACMDKELGDLDYFRGAHAAPGRRLRNFGLTLHRKKSKICASVVEYLGYQLSEDGISALSNKVTAILAIVPSRNRREVRRFVGMVNFYSDMLPRRASVLVPLSRITSPSQSFRWSASEQAAFDAVKDALAKRVLLAFPENGHPFHLYTDASKVQLGAVITQVGQPLAFWSKKNNQPQTAYPANRMELLSILLVLREFRSMLLGQELHLHTHHLNLTYSTFHDVHMMRSNIVADALSRLPISDEGSAALEEKAALLMATASEVEETATPTMTAVAETAMDGGFAVDLRVIADEQRRDTSLGDSDEQEIAGTMLRVDPNCSSNYKLTRRIPPTCPTLQSAELFDSP
ncbi:hypothetical protein PF005_g3586 [Phytophthora fragariae]|uniref:Reverse transcriptase/retrotransposon-derived protein RNase H-like domain-containing protein n=2 Tax=Phytophthora fragariae TaxID=53985 RepID=A0A6A3Z4J5_9STRA|nr:hypothetical protein PF005_g3586 [Phytophthora fragariae]KAE9256966.1 hypothetical protein PF002_g1483 [Phytophthora fragariae]